MAIHTANVDLQSHYVRMAGVWSTFADNDTFASGRGKTIH
jgi:hypothetical protein